MATQKFINNFRTTLTATYGVSDTTFSVNSVEGLPDLTNGDFYLLTLFRLDGVNESGHEVVKVTSRSGLVLTATRGIEGAAPSTFLAGDIVAARITASALQAKADQAAVDLKANTADVYPKSLTYTKTETDTSISNAMNVIIGGAPTALSTLDALAASINDDPNFWTTLSGLLSQKAALASPTFTGIPLVPTAGTNTNTQQAASTAFVMGQIAILLNSAPGALDTLGELSAAINNDPAFFTTITNALALKAPLASPALTGIPTAPTAALGTNTTQVATMAAVQAAIANLINSAPGALDTLNELATAIGNDPNFATTVTNNLATKAAKGANSDITSLSGLTTALSAPQGGTGWGSYAVGDMLYASATNALAKLAGNTTTARKFMRQTGTGSVANAPAWDTLVAGDIPSLDWSKITTGTPTTLQGYGITSGSNLNLASSVPYIYFDENDQTGAAGKWRMVADGDAWRFDKNTATARDFSTYVTPFDVQSNGVGKVNGAIPVQQGTGTGQGANTIKMGWGSSGGGLKVTVDSTDQGYIPFSTTNQNAGAGISFASPLTVSNGLNTALTVNGSALFNYGFTSTGAPAIFTGGSATNLSNNGMVQIGGQTGLNIAISDQIIQARNNGGTNNLYLNFYGGSISTGGSSANNSNLNCNGTLSATNGLSITGSAAQFNGGNPVALASGNGYKQVGGTAGQNVVYDYNAIQARNNGSANTLNLNPSGGTVYAGADIVAATTIALRNSGTWMKVAFRDGPSTSVGYIGAELANCLVAVDKDNSAYRFSVSQGGDATASGNITAYSDETLKDDWKDLYPEGGRLVWLAKVAAVKHGDYRRIDTGIRQIGAGAQSMRKVMPQAVVKTKTKDKKTILSLNYGPAALMVGMETAAEVVELRKDLDKANKLIAKLATKLGVKV